MCTDLAVVEQKAVTVSIADEDFKVNMPGWAIVNLDEATVNLKTIFSADSCYTVPQTNVTLEGVALGRIAKDVEKFFPRPVQALLLIKEL